MQRTQRSSHSIVQCGVIATSLLCMVPALATDDREETPAQRDIARQRLEVMTARIEGIVVSSRDPGIPKQMQMTPLFRYDDETRGYVDGTVWRLGEKGRPLAIITAE